MDNCVASFNGLFQFGAIANITVDFQKIWMWSENIVAIQIEIDDSNRISRFQQLRDECGAHIAGAASNENRLHFCHFKIDSIVFSKGTRSSDDLFPTTPTICAPTRFAMKPVTSSGTLRYTHADVIASTASPA